MPTIADSWIREGIEQGIEQEREDGKSITAVKMIENGMCTSDIRKITGLSVQKIAALRKKCKK